VSEKGISASKAIPLLGRHSGERLGDLDVHVHSGAILAA
jgi:hypothetical protein